MKGIINKLRIGTFKWIVITIIFSVLILIWEFNRKESSMRKNLRHHAQIAYNSVNVNKLLKLSGTIQDHRLKEYIDLNKALYNLKDKTDFKFFYIMGKNKKNDIFFFVGSENEENKDYSPPGTVYPEASKLLVSMFNNNNNNNNNIQIEGPLTDSYGTFISVFMPIFNPKTNKVVAIFGGDITVEHWNLQILRDSTDIIFLLCSILFFLFLFRGYSERRVKLIEYFNKSNKRESLEMFYSSLAHEINNPLTIIRGYAEIMKKEMNIDSLHKFGDILVSSSDRISTTLDNLNRYSKNSYCIQPLNPNIIINNTVSLVESILRKENIIFDMKLTQDNMEIMADIGELQQVFMNIIVNSKNVIKKTGINGTISIETRVSTSNAIITISNSGSPMSNEQKNQVFKNNNILNPIHQKIGQGLHISNAIIRSFHGKLEINNQNKVGTIFTITFPLITNEEIL